MEERTYYEDWQLDNVLPVPFGPRSSSSRLPAEGARHHVIDPDGNLILSDPEDDYVGPYVDSQHVLRFQQAQIF